MRRCLVLVGWAAAVLSLHPGQSFAQYVCGPQWLDNLPPVDGQIYGSAAWDPDGDDPASPLLIAGGGFATAGGLPVNNIAAFDGSAWSALGDGMNEIPWAFTTWNGDLIAGGRFTMAGGVPCNYVARWDGSQWHAMGDGFDSFVYALAVYNGELYAGGWFRLDGTQSIARWDGSAWRPVGGGMAIHNCPGTCGTSVNALRVYGGELVAAGYFTLAGGIGANYIARWNGTSWNGLGGGLNNQAEALTEYNGKLIVGGHFTRANYNSVVANRIAAWGPGWSALGEGFDKSVWALTAHHGKLFAGGAFTASGANPLSRIGAWDGTAWSAMDSGVDSSVLDLSVYDGDVVAVGHFATAGGNPSLHWARWRDTPPPQITQQPVAASVMFGECAAFAVAAAGQGTLRYQWLRNGFPISDDDRFTGAQTAELSICPVAKPDQAWYAVTVTDDCASSTSGAGFLSVTCPGAIETQPQSQTVEVGGEAHFSVVATGTGTLHYQWKRNGVPVVDDERISGANTADLRISNVAMSDAKGGTYTVTITDDCAPRTSNTATLTVTCPAFSPADLNRDCDVDMDDLATFRICAAGPNVPFNSACPRWPNDRSRALADFDADQDVDADDFAVLQRCFSGVNRPPLPDCGG